MYISAIIPAAGQSCRYGSKDKLSEDIGGRPLLLRTVEFFTKREDIAEIIIAGSANDFSAFQERFGPALGFHGVQIIKGSTKGRCESVQCALRHVSEQADYILIHDAARPALSNSLCDRLLLASIKFDAVASALPITSTVKRAEQSPASIGDEDSIADSILGSSTQSKVDAFKVSQTIDRTNLWELQTPQIFKASLLRKAYEQDDLNTCTDDAQVVEKFGEDVYLIEGDSRNIKVTTPSDVQLIRSILGIRGGHESVSRKRF